MSYQLRDGFQALANASDVRAIVLRGEGDHFMAGGDIAFFKESLSLSQKARKEKVTALIGVVHEFITTLRTMPQPIIASVRGSVAGFGMSLVAASDLAIAAGQCQIYPSLLSDRYQSRWGQYLLFATSYRYQAGDGHDPVE